MKTVFSLIRIQRHMNLQPKNAIFFQQMQSAFSGKQQVTESIQEKNGRSLQQSNSRLKLLLITGVLLISAALSYKFYFRNLDIVQEMKGKNTLASIVSLYGDAARVRLKEKFEKKGVAYPPCALIMLGLKAEELLEIYAVDAAGKARYVTGYPILGTSGVLGPKLKEGDKQMPEGFYKIREFEPNSQYHVALRVDYPSEFDKKMGKVDGREDLGSDIMIHGKDCSVGCLAMGDPGSEDLFVLVHDVGLANTELIMSPCDFRRPPLNLKLPDKPDWIGAVYKELEARICKLPNAL